MTPAAGFPDTPAAGPDSTAAHELARELAWLVATEPDTATVLRRAAAALACTLRADGCLIYRLERDGALAVAAQHPPRGDDAAAQLRLPNGFGVTGRVAADGVPAVLIDDSPRNSAHRTLLGLAPRQRVSRLCVPARVGGGEVAAVVAVHTYATRRFRPAEVALAQQVADTLALRMQFDRTARSLSACERDWEGLVAATVLAQETERRRVAGELHDGVTQVIASLTFHLSAAESAFRERDIDDAQAQLRCATELADLAFAETRNAIIGLHSPVLDDLGLPAALASLARQVPSLVVDVDVQDADLPDEAATTLYRIAQEALQNVVKHANATRARIELFVRRGAVTLRITDDGQGFATSPGADRAAPADVTTAHFGLAGMQERARLLGGQFHVASTPGRGTAIEATVPVAE